MSRPTPLSTIVALAAAVTIAACSSGAESASSPAPSVRVSISLAQAVALSAADVSHPFFDIAGGRVPRTSIDSLIVTVTRVDVLPDSLLARCRPPFGDSIRGFRPGDPDEMMGGPGMNAPRQPVGCQAWLSGIRTIGPGIGRFGGLPDSVIPFPRPDEPRTRLDSLLPPGVGWGARPSQWYSLRVVGSGRLDLMHLPTDTARGLVLAADSVPAGAYGAARLIVSDATIWLNTAVTTEDGVTLKPNTPYPVKLPQRAAGRMGIMTTAGLTVPSGGGNVVLIFDAGQMLAAPIVTDNGMVVLGPMLRPRRM